MGLSSNILWHQTNFINLKSILKSRSLKCAYSLEEVDDILNQKVAFPMVSMCDLPFSELAEYMGKYGEYAIGLSREWGIKSKFTPIWYYAPRSRVPQLLRKLIREEVNNHKDDDSDIIESLMGVVAYMKKMEGPLLRHNYLKYRFYDEREVRYVPSFEYLIRGGNRPIMTEDDYNAYKSANAGKSTIEENLPFDWSDIRYIIVKENRQIPVVIEFLENLKCNNKTIGVFSSKQIFEDVIGYKHNVESPKSSAPSFDKELVKKIVELTIEKTRKLLQE